MILTLIFCYLVVQFASKPSNKQTSLQIIHHQQIAAAKSAGLSEDQTKGEIQYYGDTFESICTQAAYSDLENIFKI